MKEILKSKVMILFVVMVLGITALNATPKEKLEDTNDVKETIISYQVN